MLITFTRSIILYIIILIVMRLMGKREIGQLQPFELVISMMIADLASIPMTDTGIPIQNGIIPILGLLFMHLIISMINMKSIKAREIICGKPQILIDRGRINEDALRQERITINELEERLRSANIVELGDVEYAILETSGQLTVIPKPNKRNTIPEDFQIEPEYEGIPYDLVIDGVIMRKNLKQIGRDENWLKKEVRKIWHKSRTSTDCNTRWEGTNFLPKERKLKKMKKEIMIAIVIVFMIIVLNIITQKYTDTHLGEITNQLTNIRNDLIQENYQKGEEEIKFAKETWDKAKETLVIYIEHEELEKVEMYLLEANSHMETKEYAMAIQSLDTANFIIHHIQEKYQFSLENIF